MTKKERLVEFVATVEELEKNRFYPECLRYVLTLDLPPKALSLTMDHDAFKSFLIVFRRFFLHKDDCRIDRVYDASLIELRGTKKERWIRLSQRRMEFARKTGAPLVRSVNGLVERPDQLFEVDPKVKTIFCWQ